jgi:RNA-directed DNA polymerase
MKEMSTVEMQIEVRAKKYPNVALTNLHEFIDERFLYESFNVLNKKSASGVDQQTWKDYNEGKAIRIPVLLQMFKNGTYRAPNIRRVYIPKGDVFVHWKLLNSKPAAG